MGMLRNGGGCVGMDEQYILVSRSPWYSSVLGSPGPPSVVFATLVGNPVDYAILPSRFNGVLRSHPEQV